MARYIVNFICSVPWEGGLLGQGTAALLVLLMLHLESGSRADALSHGAQGRAGADPDLGEGRESVVPISELESWEQTTELGPQVIQGRGGLVAVLGGLHTALPCNQHWQAPKEKKVALVLLSLPLATALAQEKNFCVACIWDAPLGVLWRTACAQAQVSSRLCENIIHIG